MSRPSVIRAVFTLALLCSLSRSQNNLSQNLATPDEITGTVSCRERSALPSGAVVNVRLQDVSLQDAPAKLVSEVNIHTAGKQIPFHFRLPYASVDIDPSHSYAVSATIQADGKLLFISTTSYPVITRGAPRTVSIIVSSVGAARLPEAPRQ
jgi:putative lipoprotein